MSLKQLVVWGLIAACLAACHDSKGFSAHQVEAQATKYLIGTQLMDNQAANFKVDCPGGLGGEGESVDCDVVGLDGVLGVRVHEGINGRLTYLVSVHG